MSEVITRVRDGFGGDLFRPMLPELYEKGKDISGILTVLESGWTEKPADRPTARHMLQDVKKISPFKSVESKLAYL